MLLCSDGLTEMVHEEEINDILQTEADPEQGLWAAPGASQQRRRQGQYYGSGGSFPCRERLACVMVSAIGETQSAFAFLVPDDRDFLVVRRQGTLASGVLFLGTARIGLVRLARQPTPPDPEHQRQSWYRAGQQPDTGGGWG